MVENTKKFLLFGALSLIAFGVLHLLRSQMYKQSKNIAMEIDVQDVACDPQHFTNELKPGVFLEKLSFKDQAIKEKGIQEYFNQALDRFKKTKDYGEISLQSIIDLLGFESKVVQHLLANHTGAAVEYALDRRNSRLECSTPSVMYMYDTILNLATFDTRYKQPMINAIQRNKQLARALSQSEQQQFLCIMQDRLNYYRTVLRALQCAIAQGSSTNPAQVYIDSDVVIQVCPNAK